MLAHLPNSLSLLTSSNWSNKHVAPPALKDAGTHGWVDRRSFLPKNLKSFQNSCGEETHSLRVGSGFFTHNQAIQLQTSGCFMTANCEWPSWRKFFGFRMQTVTHGDPKVNWFCKLMSSRLRARSSPGLRSPKNPNPTSTLNVSSLSFSSLELQVSALSLAKHVKPMRIGNGI